MAEVDKKTIRRWRKYLAEERLEADTYRMLARGRYGTERDILLALSEAEERHEQHWLQLLGPKALPAPKAPLRSRILNFFTRTIGSVFVLAMMQRSEQRSEYDSDCDATEEMAADEHIHGEVVRSLAQRQRSQISGTFRAAVFGINDGLVSTCALILGVMGTGTSKMTIIATGLAGLLAGALSMGAGEYVSVQSQTELLAASDPNPQSDDALTKLNINHNELALVFRARGDDQETAEQKAKQTLADISAGQEKRNVLVGEKHKPEEIGDGRQAALSSFMFFALGAFVPLFPFLLPISVFWATIISVTLVGILLLITGGIVGLLSGSNPVTKAFRQLVIGYGAAAITFSLGYLLGVNIS